MATAIRTTLAVVLVTLLGSAPPAAAAPRDDRSFWDLALDRAAAVSQVATRGVPFLPEGGCTTRDAAALAAEAPGTRQLVVIDVPTATATVGTLQVLAAAPDGTWRCQVAPTAAMVGRTGVRPIVDRRSGDGTTPAGSFPLGTVTAWDGETFEMFGNRPDPGVRVRYRDVRREDCWGATPGASTYQRLYARPGCPGPDDEWLPRYGDVYAHAAVIGANLDPVSGDEPGEPPLAAAIFLHRHSYDTAGRPKPTSGCVSLPIDELVTVLQLLDPALAPRFVIRVAP
jgi:L,D-peptidoglycan transpeptidase YkuD (ErfK/YbiS/YcfS/YnhG family)